MPPTQPNPTAPKPLILAWLATGLFIPCLSAIGRPLQHWTFQNVGETTAGWVIGLLLVGLGAMALHWLAGLPLTGKHYTIILTTIVLLGVFIAIIVLLPRTEERLHFVTFGLFGFLCRRLFPLWAASIVMLLWAGGDELFQAWLPDRVGDWRDVGMNTLAGAIGLGVAWLGSRYSQHDKNSIPSSSRGEG